MIKEKISKIFSILTKDPKMSNSEFIIMILTSITITTVLFYFMDLSSYKNTIKVQERIIKTIRKSDSLYNSELNKQSDLLSNYFNDSSFKYNGQSFSASSLISELDRTQSLYHIYDSINNVLIQRDKKLLDSINDQSIKLDVIKRAFGIIVTKRIIDENTSSFNLINSRVDTALVLYPLFIKKLTIDSLGLWILRIDDQHSIRFEPHFKRSSTTLVKTKR